MSLTAQCIRLEAKLSPDEMRLAVDRVARLWGNRSGAPPHVWHATFTRILAERTPDQPRQTAQDGERPQQEIG